MEKIMHFCLPTAFLSQWQGWASEIKGNSNECEGMGLQKLGEQQRGQRLLSH